jgi:hypothetical protein
MVCWRVVVELDPVTGRKTPLAALVRRALTALNEADIPYALIGATAQAVRCADCRA